VRRGKSWKILFNIPWQYRLGRCFFLSEVFYIKEGVFIPRRETEGLIDLIKEKSIFNGDGVIVDVGCGAGVIGIFLKRIFPKSRVFAVDISDTALEIAKKNSLKHNVDLIFLKSNFLDSFKKVDLIVSNPPYVREWEYNFLSGEVKREPWVALNGGWDGFRAIDKILESACKILSSNGEIFLEIAPYLVERFRRFEDIFRFEFFKDFRGFVRYVYARFRV